MKEYFNLNDRARRAWNNNGGKAILSGLPEFSLHTIEVSNEDKVFFPESGITKGDLICYYRDSARIMLLHILGRPLAMHRFPDGITEEGFYQKEIPDYFPPWVDRVIIEKKEGGTNEQVVCNNAATLVYLANQACITPHVWLSRTDTLNYPDKLVFDLDPPDGDFEPVRAAAFALKDHMKEMGLEPFVMTTGSRGAHVVTPLDCSQDFDSVRTFAERLADSLAQEDPDHLTTEQRKNKWGSRVFLDTLRNSYAQTSVAPYAVRARPHAPIAVPLEWEELEDTTPQSYTIQTIFAHYLNCNVPLYDAPAFSKSVAAFSESFEIPPYRSDQRKGS